MLNRDGAHRVYKFCAKWRAGNQIIALLETYVNHINELIVDISF